MTRWEALFGTTTATTDVVIQAGSTVVLHGCAQFNSTVNVRSILVQSGATVGVLCRHALMQLSARLRPGRCGCAATCCVLWASHAQQQAAVHAGADLLSTLLVRCAVPLSCCSLSSGTPH